MGKNTTSTSSQLKRATYASITQGALVLWPAKTHGNLGARYQRGRRILQTGGLRGSIRVRHLLDVTLVAVRGWADVGLWVAVCFLAKISFHRPTCKTTFARLTQSQAISQSFRVFITFRSMRDTTFFHLSKHFFCTKLGLRGSKRPAILLDVTRFLYHGDQKISWWRICRWRAVNLEIHLWSSGVTAFGDRPASSMSKFSASVNSDLWVWSYQLTSDLRDVYFGDMHTCLAMVVSESSFCVWVCLRRPAGLHRNQRSCHWSPKLVNVNAAMIEVWADMVQTSKTDHFGCAQQKWCNLNLLHAMVLKFSGNQQKRLFFLTT